MIEWLGVGHILVDHLSITVNVNGKQEACSTMTGSLP